jgi:hypothetical protein
MYMNCYESRQVNFFLPRLPAGTGDIDFQLNLPSSLDGTFERKYLTPQFVFSYSWGATGYGHLPGALSTTSGRIHHSPSIP